MREHRGLLLFQIYQYAYESVKDIKVLRFFVLNIWLLRKLVVSLQCVNKRKRYEKDFLRTSLASGRALKNKGTMRVIAIPVKDSEVRQRIQDMQMLVSWRGRAHAYLGKSASWL